MELAEEDRKKKLAAGREKLAAFRKKQAHRRRTQWDGGEGDRACTTESQSNGSPKVSTSEIFFTPNDSSSVTGEEPEVHSSVYYHTKLASANQRIAELEEAVEGKQLALDKMVMEMQSTALGVANKNGEDRSCNESGFELKGSVLELKEALMQRDGIIRQLTSHLQWRSASEGDAYFDVPHYLQETQRLSEEVSLLQQQLCQAGETLRNQESTCQASVHALQEAKEQIVSLRFKITEKNELLKQLSQNLADKSADLLTSKSRELELVALVKELQQQAVREAEARQVMSDTAQADANRVCLLEEELEELTNQQEEMAKEFAEMQERLRNAETLCGALQKEKGEALEKIAYLEMELDRLVEDKDRAFARLSDLEEKIQDRSAIIQTSQDCDLEYGDPSERVMELEREISDLSRDHRMYIDHLNQRNAELEMLLAENLVPSRSDMSDLKNKINSQQNEILSLASQLQAAEAENAFHKVQVAELQEQLEELQKESAKEQEKHAAIRNSLEREIHVLQAGNSEYKIKLSSLEDEIVTLKQELNSSSSAVQVTVPTDSEILECEDKTVDGSGFADSTSKHLALLQKSYSNLETQFTTLLQQNSQLQSDMSDYYNLKQMHGQQESTIRDLLSQVDHLQDAAEDWTLQVQEKNYQVENLQSQLTAALKEKEELMHQISQQSEIVEKQTYSADTRVRKLESRISSLGSELTDFKEALKESETANIELQDKYDAVRCELETVKSQFAVSETRATELRSEWDLEKDQLLKNLQEKAGELEKVFAEKTGFLAAAEDAEIQHQQLLKALEAQYAEILQRNKHVLSERDQLIVSHSHETVRLEENLKQKTEELENLLLEKNQIASELSAVLAIKAEMQQQLKSQELAQTELANKHYSQKLSQAEEERVLECTKFTEELEQKAQEVLLLRAEKENLASDKESKETELNAQLQDLKQQLEEKVKELASVISEKEKVVQELALLQQLQKTEMQTLQVSLDQQIREHLQTASATENVACNWEFVRSELSNQLLVVQRKLEEKDFTSADLTPNPSPLPLEASTEARILQVNLQDGAQEMQILMAENERLIELLNSEQSATAKSRHLQTLLKQREAELVILMSEWKAKEAEHQSRESALARSLKAAQQTVKEKEALLDRKKISLQDLAASTERQDETVDKLSLELARAAEQLAVTEQLSHDVLQSKQQEVKSLESKVNQLALELASVHEERDSRMASLADQAEMFRAKEEEIVAENNSLNHQLEELKIEAQKMAEQNRAEQESMKMEMEGNKGQVHAKDLELQSLAEEMCHQKNLCELQSSSIVSLEREKEELELRLLELEKEAAEVQNDYHTQCRALQAEISELKLEREERDSRFEQEKQQLVEKSILLKDQLESATSELEQLQKDLNDRTKELESVKMDLDSMHHQKNTLQHDFAAHLEDMHAKMESREEEILALSIQLRDSTEQLKQQRAAGQEEAAAAQAELDEKNLVVASLQEELDAMRLQLEQTREDKETLKSNFDCCMEEMTQKASEQEDTIKQLQSRLAERSDIVNRDHGQLQEIYESQLSDLEHRLAMATEEIQCLENAVTLFESEKTKLQETYSNQITELEVSLQSAELEQLRVKDQMSKMAEAHEKEILDIKHSFEIQLATVEENCQTLEKALAKQDTLMVEAAVKFKQEKAEREKNFELQMSELYELSRIHETEVGRVKRQMDEMRKDHQKENQDLQQCLETQIFELENKCSIATCELDRMRSSLWTMEGDFSTEKNALEQKISELEDLCLSREKQVLELQDKFTRLNVLSEESNTSLIESHQSEIFHLEEANSHMAEEIKQLQGKLMTAREIHNQEMEALKHHQAEEISILQERYRQIETHSQMLQSHVVPLSAQPAYVEMSSPNSEEDKLQVELTTLEGSISVFQETLTQKEQELSQLQSQVSTLASDIDRKDGEIRSLTHEVENERAKYIQLQMMYSDLECNNEQLTFSNHHMEENDEPCKERRHLPSPEKDILMAEHKQRALATTSQLQRIDHLQHKDGSHGNSVQEPAETVQQFGSVCLTSEGFEPEPDSVESLDIANMNRNSLDYFVEETDTCTTRGHRGRPRVHSLPAAVFEGFEPDLQTLSFSSEHNGKVLTSKARAQKEAKSEPASSAGCFEPEEESVQSQSEETEKVEGTFTEDSFQPESLTDAPTIVHPCFTTRDQGFLPLCLDTLPASPMVIKKLTKVKDSCTQTEHLPGDSCRVLASGVCSNLANDAQSDLSADKKIEEEQSHPAPALQSAESVTGVAKETVELEVSRRLAALRSDLEERWVHKMRLQEIELHHQHDTERIEYRKQLEQQCHQQVEAAKHENYVAFVKAVRQMKKSFDQKKKHLKTAAGHQGRKPDKESREDGVESPVSTVGQAEEETLVKQLHKENQELAEVRDELLQQIAISRTQALRKTMQHELQTIVSECSKHLPPEATSDGALVIPGLAGRHQGRVAEKIASILQRGEIKQQMAAVFQELLTLSQQSGSTSSEGSKATPYSNDASPACEGDSEATSAQQRFLEELEEMSQQSGQDLPLEWELTSATVTQADTTIGDFDHDQMGTGSVWEVFDGRCLRQDCLELESIKQKHEAEMASLRQQLEEHRQHSEDIHLQLQEQYLQAVSSLRDGLAQAQQQELDAVVGQLQELHQRQLQQLHAEHKYDMELEVMAVRVAVEQIQTARVRLMEEEHNQHLQRLKKEHKDQLNALRAEADRLRAGEGLIPLSACEELTRQYQQLVQRISQSLERQVLTHVHEDHDPNKDTETVEGEETASPDDVITPQQAKALQATLQAQQEEVLHLRSELLAEYDRLLQQRSAQATQQTSDVLRLQEEMAALQQQYEQQIKEFQAHLNKKSELKEMQEPYEQADDIDTEQVKARYEQRIADMEDSFTRQIVALEQTTLHIPDDAIDALTSKLAAYSCTENESPLPSQRLVFVKDYVHRSTFVDGTSNVDTDTTASSWGMYDHEDRRLQEFIKTMEEKNSQVEELERSLDRERQRTNDFVAELGSSSQQLSKLAAELEEQKQVVQKMVVLLEEKDRQLQETHHKVAESEKLLREITEKEDRFQKEEGHEDGLHDMHESDIADSGLVASPSSAEEEVRRMKTALEQATAALRAMEQRERRLQEQLEEFEHQHQEALEALRQEMEHEAQMERDSLQSEFQVQLEVEMRRQAAELQRQFVEQTARTMGITSDSCPASSRGDVLEEEGAVVRTAAETSAPPHIEAGETVQETVVVQEVCVTLETLHSANRGVTSVTLLSSGTQTEQTHVDVSQNLVGANIDSMKEQLKSDFDKQVEQLQQAHEAEKTRLAKTHLEEMKGLQNELLDAEEKYNRLKEVIEEHEGAGVDQLLKDRYDMELELAKSLMQKEFDDTLAAEKKKFVERHRQLMDGFMSEQEAEADKIKQQHQQNLSDLKSCLATMYMAIIADLQALLRDQKEALLVSEDDFLQVPSEKEKAKSQEEEKDTDVKDTEDADLCREEGSEDVVVHELHRLRQNLRELCHLVAKLTMKYDKAVTNLTLQHEARLSELKAEHQDQLEAAALDTDVLKSELELAHADLESLRQKLASQLTTKISNPDQLENEKTSASHSSREGDQTPDVRSSLEYEETDEEGSTHSFSSMLGKTRSFDNGSEVKTASPSHTEQRIKQLKAEIEQLTQQLEQQQISAHPHAPSTVAVSPPSVEAVASLGARRGSRESESVVAMLQSDLDRISAERDTIQQINNRLLQLLSDSIHTYVEVEDHINRRLHNIVSVSGARPQSPTIPPHDGSENFPALSGAGVAASSSVVSRATGIMSSPRSDHGWQPGEADTSLTLEETSILSIATDEGLDMSQRLADSIFTGPDIGAEGEEIVGDARGRLQSAVGHLLDMITQTTQQLVEAKITQTDLLQSLAARSSDNSALAARIQDLEEQLRQEVSAKEYFSLELHKAEGLIKGYSSEREMMEEELQLLEEQKETLARNLETTRSQLQDFQDAAGELEARRQDVERHQMLLQQNAGQEAQESSMAGGDTNKSEEQALLAEVNTVKQERREQTLQLQHRLEQAQQNLHDREANLEELERALQGERDEMREQVEDLKLQLENAERQLKSNKQFLDDQMNERELEREEFQREIERLKQQLQDKDRQEGSHVSLHHEIQDLTEQVQVRMEREAVMHQKMQELQQTLQDSDLSAQDLRVWIAALEKELDQRGDVEQQLKDHIHKLERQLTQDNSDAQSVESSSPVATCRPVSPGSADLSPRQPTVQPALSYVSLEEELKRSQQAKEELVHQKEALKHTVQEQLLQISALRNQLDDLRHWRGPPDPSASASTTADLRDELESEREAVQKKEEEIFQLKTTLENLEKQLAIKQRELEQLTDQFQKLQQTSVTSDQMAELEKERNSLKARIGELSAAHAFPPELLEEKNAEIDELRHHLSQKEVWLKEKDELISDLQDTVLSLQRGETCLDVSLPFNEPVSLNASFTERPPAVVEQPTCLTTLAQELDQTASEQEGQIVELNSRVERLGQEVAQLKDQLQEAVAGRTALETELQQKDDDLSQLQEEKAQKQETLVEKDSRLEQLMVQVKSLQTEINNLTAFQIELQKDYDTVQNMLEEKEQEIESLTREYLEARSQPDGSDELEAALAVAQKKLREQGNIIEEKEEELYELRDQLEAMGSLKEELNTLTTRLAEKEAELQKEKNLLAEVQKELKGIQQAEHNQEQNTDHLLAAVARTLEEQMSLLKAEVLHLEESVKDKEQLIKNLEDEKCAAAAKHEMELATIRNHLTATQDEVATKLSHLEMLLAHKEHSLQQVESLRDEKLHAKEQEATALREALEKKSETIEKLEGDVLLLQQQVTERDSSIRDLHQRSQQQQDHLKGEITHLEEQLHHLSSTTENAATDEGKALQNELAQASDRIVDLEQQLVSTQSHLEEALTQAEEKENRVQQLQEEMRRLQLGAAEGQAEDLEQRVRVDSLSYLPESSEYTEVRDERLRDILAKAEQMQMMVQESLSASLPMPSDTQRLSRWDSEPGLSSTYPAQLVTLTFGTETWMRRQQRELASKNRELALLREELEGWLKRKGRSQETLGSASTVLQLYEKESVIISLKRELTEAKALLAAAEKRAAQSSESFVSMELSPQTKQQIAHLRSELRLAKAALAALQEHSQADAVSTYVGGEAKHVEQRELNNHDAETQLHHSSTTMSATDFVKKVQELREEITLEHQNHIRDIQEAARHDMEIKMTEMQARHDHEVQQLRSRHEQRLEQALAHQQQALEKQHKTELNSLCVQHQQEIERLRSEELASLTDSSITNRLRVDVRDTQQVEDGLISSFHSRSDDGSRDDLSTVETSSVVSGSEEVLPPRLQALLNRLRKAGDHILSISELNFLLQHLAPQGEASSQTLVEAFESEKSSLVKTTHALKELLSQADRVGCGLQEIEGDWRSELLHALVEVYKRERLTLESELYTLRLQHPSMATADIIKSFDNRLREQEQLQQSGLDAMLRAERQSLLAELEDLRSCLLRQRTEQQEQQARLSDALAKMEEQASSKEWKLQREVQVLEYKLQQEKVIQEDLQKRLEAERRHTTELSAELSRSKAALTLLQSELQSTHIQLSRARDALEREQHRFTSVTDALEEERQKNNRLAEMLETLRRQHHNLETERSRLEAIYKERETTENKVIKELRAELASQRENLRKTTESAEKERWDRQQALTAASEVQQVNLALRQEVDKVQHQTKKVLEGEATKLQELQNKMKQDHMLVGELQGALEDRDSIIARLTRELSQLDDLQLQVQQLQKTMASSEQQLEKERKQVSHLTNILDKEREEHGAALQQERGQAKQLRSELSALKAEASDACHQLDLEKARAEGLHLDLERVQSELRALTQHAGVTERQLEAEQTATWNRLRAAQHEKDELEIKVHQLELELERMQDKVQDLELELDRCRQRELEARHDVERHKLYPAVSPRMTSADGQTEVHDAQLQARLCAFIRQLQGVGERLHVLLLRQSNRSSTTDAAEEASRNHDGSSVGSLLQELQALRDKMFSRDQFDGGDSKQMVELDQLRTCLTTLTREKEELQRRLDLLENEDNIRTLRTSHTNTTISTSSSSSSAKRQKQPPTMPQYVSDAASDDEFIYERTVWASERLSLQMALDSAEREIDHLKKELRHFRGRFDSEGFMVEADKNKMQRLYGKYLRAESFRKALVYQKKYLLLLLGGYQDSEQETLAIIATMGGQPSSTLDLAYRRRHRRLYTIFRSAARTVVAIFRMKYLVRKWKRATRVGSPIVGGRLNHHYGYVATAGSFTQPNFTDPDSRYSSPSATSLYVNTVMRGSPNGNAMSLPSHSATSRLVSDGGGGGNPAGVRFSTPPTKEFTHTQRPSNSPLSTNARRHLLHILDAPQKQSGDATEDSGGCLGAIGGESLQTDDGVGDDFLQRLENLQTRLSSQNGPTMKRPAWR